MITIILCKGAPASGKSTYAQLEVAKDPINTVRINNDLIRSMLNNSVFDNNIEKLVSSTRLFLIQEAINRNISTIIIDNVNANKKHFNDVFGLAQKANKDIVVVEKPFYQPLEVLFERDAKRIGTAKVGEQIVKKFFKALGGDSFKSYKPKKEVFAKNNNSKDKIWVPMVQDITLPKAVIFDIDGTCLAIGDRSPYDASNSHIVDTPIESTTELVKMYFNAGYKIIFCSGRSEKDRNSTTLAINKCLSEISYQLFMRPNGNNEKDSVIKERIFNDHIKNQYFVIAVFDDRLQVCRLWHKLGLRLYRVGDPDANF